MMMTTRPSVDELLERDLLTLTAVEWRIVAESDPAAFTEFLVCLEARSDSDARRRLLAKRLAASIPFQPKLKGRPPNG